MIQKPRGTKDIYGEDEIIYKFIFDQFDLLAKSYNLKKIITPMFESYELFKKTTGESSDIVSKEIYKFQDFGKRELALRPEGTASVGRAIIENNLMQEKKYNKLYYMGSMFRYEKPQKGRMRQFFQIGIELTNELNNNVILDSILIAKTFLDNLKINDYVLLINNLGVIEERNKYISELKKYFKLHEDKLSEDSKKRITTNPLRILDDKEDSKLEVVKNAPKIFDFLSDQTKKEFSDLLTILDKLNIKYEIDYSLVRGLDYYSNVVYEFVSHSKYLGSKATLIGGGCYLDLMNSKSYPINGVGFGCGVERLFEIIKGNNTLNTKDEIDVFFVIEQQQQYLQALPIIWDLRKNFIKTEYNYKTKNYKKIFNDAKYFSANLIVFQELNQIGTDYWMIKKNNDYKITSPKDQLFEQIKKLLNN